MATRTIKRPVKTLTRDAQVLRHLKQRKLGYTMAEVQAQLELPWGLAYCSLGRLREQGLVEKAGTGTRTPKWRAVR